MLPAAANACTSSEIFLFQSNFFTKDNYNLQMANSYMMRIRDLSPAVPSKNCMVVVSNTSFIYVVPNLLMSLYANKNTLFLTK